MRRSERRTMSVTRTSLPRLLSDTGQKKTPEKKDVHRMSFQRPKGTVEYSVDSIDTLNSIALKFDTTPNELVQLNKLFSRAVIPGKVLYVPDPEYVSSAESSPSLSPISPLSPTSCEADLEKVTMDSDDVHRMDATLSPAHPLSRPAPVVSSTFEEEEAMTEKFLKINCKYITDGKGVVNGVLLVTPNNVMFDPHKTDLLVQDRGCEEYGIMCLLEEVMSAAMCTVVTDSRIKEFVPPELELLSSVPDPCQMNGVPRSNLEDVEQRACHAGNDSACTAPRSTEASLFEDVFTESELSPVQDNQGSSDELRLNSSVASSESVQTINQAVPDPPNPNPSQGAGQAPGRDETSRKGCTTEGSQLQKRQLSAGSRQKSVEAGDQGGALSTTSTSTSTDFPIICEGQAKSHTTSESQGSDTVAAVEQSSVQEEPPGMWKDGQAQESELGMEQLRKLWKSHTMQSASEQRDWDQQEAKTTNQDQSEEGAGKEYLSSLPPATTFPVPKEKRRQQSHKFLCLRVGKPMRKTFVSHASASMQQYAQRDRKHEYWFAVPHERSDHLYAFFVQWNADMYGEDMEGGGVSREPEFIVVKNNLEPETLFDKPPVPDITAKEWEVVSVAEYQQRTDALNSEDLRSLCRRLQITTKEVNSKHSPAIRTDLGSEIFWPNLSEPSDLLQTDQIEKLAKNLPPRTIGYHWSLAFSTNKHGMSIKTLYRAMKGLDTPVLMVIKDSDGHMFGALASEPFKVSDGFYGTGETFLFTFFPDFEVFKWTGDNMFFLKGDMDSLAFGGGGGEFGLWIDGDLYHGRSNPCKTFGNPMLSKKEDFFLQDVEIWTFQ